MTDWTVTLCNTQGKWSITVTIKHAQLSIVSHMMSSSEVADFPSFLHVTVRQGLPFACSHQKKKKKEGSNNTNDKTGRNNKKKKE